MWPAPEPEGRWQRLLRRLGLGGQPQQRPGMTANDLLNAQQQAFAQQLPPQQHPGTGPWPQQYQQQQHPYQQAPAPTGAAWPQQPPSPAMSPPQAAPQAAPAHPEQPQDTPASHELPAQPQAQDAEAAEDPATPPLELVTGTLAGLAMRDLALVDSLIEVVEDLEDSSEDPELLERLFKIDNLATRMRRNSENLLVLAGQDTGDPSAEPVPMLDVARAAISEIKDYQRVQIGRMPAVFVSGSAADDLSHLLAELMDNATGKSPEHAQVVVTAQYMADGERLLITVQDEGIGIPDSQLALLNERLHGDPVLDEQTIRHMGLYVVSNIAHRHGIEVQLEARAFRGISAHVVVPGGVFNTTGPVPAAEPAPRPVAPTPLPRRPAADPAASAPVPYPKEDRSAMDSSSVTAAGLPRRSAHRSAAPLPMPEPEVPAVEPAETVDRAERIRDDLAGFLEGEQEAAREGDDQSR
ncbi:sensor histidine kinase [Streptomonospora mangrovi]|nr:ATP-binding protein [Streptomonospora mangrovi]